MASKGKFILVFVACTNLLGCHEKVQTPPLETPKESSEEDEIGFLKADRVFALYGGVDLEASTKVTVKRGASVVTIRDDKALKRARSGSFEATVTRRHEGSEGGDSQERFEAIYTGGTYFTRSSGPFVRWDDNLDEPSKTVSAIAGETEAILAFMRPCLKVKPSTDRVELSISHQGCTAQGDYEGERYKVTFEDASGFIRLVDAKPAEVHLLADFSLTVEGHLARLHLEHESRLRPIPSGYEPNPPPDYIPSRRFRPLQMAKGVLTGLSLTWGPGAPRALIEGVDKASRQGAP